MLPRIAESLASRTIWDKAEVDGFVVVSGPGSFTGLRVGLSTVKGLCEVLGKPLATVSMLEALVITHGRPGESVIAVLDAGRAEIYVGEYRLASGNATVISEYIAKLDECRESRRASALSLLTADEKICGKLAGREPQRDFGCAGRRGRIGRIGIHKLLAGETADPATIDVNYVRRSDAELFSAAKKTQC